MIRSRRFPYLVLISALTVITLTGCSGFNSIPDTVISQPDVYAGAIQGSVYGGHAPVTSAEVFVLQTGQNGYAGAFSSTNNKLTRGADGSDATYGPYVLTDSTGQFNLANKYTCTPGQPVYLVAKGGSTSVNIGGSGYASSPITITSAAETGSSPVYQVTFQGNNLLYPNQQVVLSGLGGGYIGLNGTQTVIAATATSFTIITTTAISGSSTGTATVISNANPAIINMAVIGVCPSTGNFSSTSTTGSYDVIKYVYMNEVSTTAGAYALSGFGSGPFTIGIPSGDSLALTGIQNATVNAGQLYDIQGGNTSGTFNGEGHIARSTTPAGNGYVTQNTLDTLGNILASCVDSNNTGNGPNPTTPSTGVSSTTCSKLFTYATSNGIPYGSTGAGTVPTDIATAAFNIAHYPAGSTLGSTSYTSTFISQLFLLQGAEAVPFYPDLSIAPNDFTVGIKYPPSLNIDTGTGLSPVSGVESLAIDGAGNVWLTSQTVEGTTSSGYISELSPTGTISFKNYNNSYTYGYVSVDGSNNAWTGNAVGTSKETEYSQAGALLSGSGYGPSVFDSYATITDYAGNAYVAYGPSTGSFDYIFSLSSTGMASTPGAIGSLPLTSHVGHGAIDSAGSFFLTSEDGNSITRVTSGGLTYAGFPFNSTGITTVATAPSCLGEHVNDPEFPAVDGNGNVWIPNYAGGSGDAVLFVAPTSIPPVIIPYCVAEANDTGSGSSLNGPFAAAIDGADTVWITNRTGNSLTQLTLGGAQMSPSTNYQTNYIPGSSGSGLFSGPLNLAIDGSGDIWVANYSNSSASSSLSEIIGAATPTYTPLSSAAHAGKLGAKP
jgi:hypothetical protein